MFAVFRVIAPRVIADKFRLSSRFVRQSDPNNSSPPLFLYPLCSLFLLERRGKEKSRAQNRPSKYSTTSVPTGFKRLCFPFLSYVASIAKTVGERVVVDPPRGVRIYHEPVNRRLIRGRRVAGRARGLSSAWFTIEVTRRLSSASLHKMLLNPARSKSISAVNSPLSRANFAYPYVHTRARLFPSFFLFPRDSRSRVWSNGKYHRSTNGTPILDHRRRSNRSTVRIFVIVIGTEVIGTLVAMQFERNWVRSVVVRIAGNV